LPHSAQQALIWFIPLDMINDGAAATTGPATTALKFCIAAVVVMVLFD
jgi:hypothetical protein